MMKLMINFYNIKLKNKNFILNSLFLCYFSDNSNNIVFKYALKIYNDPLNQRSLIRIDNNRKIGVYCWINKINSKFYIGSGDPLYLRISDYYQNWYILSRTNLYIVRAIIKYGMKNFSLVILEYSDSDNVISCEQKWINLLKPEYNISLTARNIKGYKHTKDNIEKMCNSSLNRKQEVKQSMSESHIREKNLGKKHSTESLNSLKVTAAKRNKSSLLGLKVEITNIETKLTTIYESIRKAAEAIGSDIKTILRREKLQIAKGINTPYRKKYLIVIKR